MPIRQLKSKNSDSASHGFSTHSIGGQRLTSSPRPRPSAQSWDGFFGGGGSRAALPPRRRRDKKSFAGRLVRPVIFLFFVFGILTVSAFAWYSKDLPDPNRIIERDVAQSTKIYDRTGEKLLYEIHGTERRTLIELSDIPQYAIDATISVEDKNFFKHKGLSLTGIVRALILESLSKVGLYKKNVPGGSTLTQQFIKNAVLTNEKYYSRKIKEWVLAYRLEQKFTKSEILKLYFNEIPYGSTAYGIEAASHIYFDKPAKNLTIGEAAVLAALPQAPSYYSPYGSHKDDLISRQRFILKLMVEQGYLTQGQANTAREEEIVFKKKREDIKAPHFVFMIKEQLSQRYGERLVEQGGLTIITTLDLDRQQKAESAVNEFAPANLEKYNASNASLVSIDVRTGEILAMVGSKDYFDDDIKGQVNVATSPRQPGSSIKPLIYAEAFNRGYRPETTVYDLVTSFAASGKEYKPQDYDGKERGPVSLRQALQGSLNIPAVKMLYLVGINRALELAKDLGYTTLTDPDRYGLSLVLGGAEVSLLEHTNAYASYAREGVAKPWVSVLKVTDSSGSVLEEHHDSEGKRALPREVVRTLTNILSDNDSRAFIFGAANRLTLPGRPVAAKTGTTNNYHDAWTLGYTPSVATGVWVGNSDNAEMKKGADGSVIAAPIWQKYMMSVLENTLVEQFKAPEPVPPCTKPMLCGVAANETVIKINSENGKLASPYTPQSKIQELHVREAHSILHYIDKGDPAGPVPANPAQDPQYPLWEEPVRKWAGANGYTNQTIPTEVDDQYQAGDLPNISLTAPRDGEQLTTATYTFNAQVSGPRPITKVQYSLNDRVVGTSFAYPYSYIFKPTAATPNGPYTLTAAVFDTLGYERRTSVSVTLAAPRDALDWDISWTLPGIGGTYTAATVPSAIVLSISNPSRLRKIDFYYKFNGSPVYLGYQGVNDQTVVTQPWTPPTTTGDYRFYLVVTDTNNNVTTLPEIPVTLAQ